MGKSAAGEILGRLGVPVVDTDQLAREVVAPGTPGLAAVLAEFGEAYRDAAGGLDRAALGRHVFADPTALDRLNRLLHPRIRDAWHARVATWRDAGEARGAVTIPLLYENGYEAEFDTVVCLACSTATQHTRLRARGWDEAEVTRRLASQLPVSEKMRRAGRVVWTEGTLAVHAAQWEWILGRRPMLFNGPTAL